MGETNYGRQRKSKAYQARVDSGTFLFVPRELSQAAACDGNAEDIFLGEKVTSTITSALSIRVPEIGSTSPIV